LSRREEARSFTSWNRRVCVLRFDAAKAKIKPLKDFVPPTKK
jgi:hypothetical protein